MSSIIPGGRGPILPLNTSIESPRTPSEVNRAHREPVQREETASVSRHPETNVAELDAARLRGSLEARLDSTVAAIVSHLQGRGRVDLRNPAARAGFINELKDLFVQQKRANPSLTAGNFLEAVPLVFNPTTLASGMEEYPSFLSELGSTFRELEGS